MIMLYMLGSLGCGWWICRCH